MFLKSLTLKGFKSFAEPTTLEFEPGVTVVVGPNGSGKSNVVDAVAWVLGAQGPRTVRSSKMEDVIFAGTSDRPALGRAEVSLTIDNSEGLLDIGFSEVTITRTLFRSGDSEYAINGVPCRLLDIQELLSDSGVGRQQHVIVSQGNLDAILNSRAEERRLVIEEAAGVLKYRKRREKAQRRLEATEGNFLRLQDLLREVRRQLRPLERQADAARRHGALVEELAALRLHQAGRELASLEGRAGAAASARAELAEAESTLQSSLSGLDEEVARSEAMLASQGADDLSDLLVRYESARERVRGLAALLAERRRGIERERDAFVDQAVVASLEADRAALAAELAEVDAEVARLMPDAERLQDEERRLAEARREFEENWSEEPEAMPATEAAEVRGELGALRDSRERGAVEADRLRAQLSALEQKGERLAAEADRLRAAVAEAQTAEEPLSRDHAAAQVRLAAAEADQTAAEEARRAAEGEWHAWAARRDALALALDEARARAGAELLADVDGVVGTLLELVEVDEGWQEAFEAAAGEAITGVVVDDVDAARTALAHLRALDASAAVVALGRPAIPAATVDVPGARRVRDHVRASRPDVDRLLDTLLAGAVAVDGTWDDALRLAIDSPDLVVVTGDGDRFSGGTWRLRAGGAGATGAALEEARVRADQSAATASTAAERVAAARRELETARAEEARLARALDENDARLSGSTEALARVESEQRDVETEAGGVREHFTELQDRVRRAAARVAELETRLPELEAAEQEGAARASAYRTARSSLEERAAAVAALRTDIEVRAAGLEERRTFLARRLEEVEARLRRNAAQAEQMERTRAAIDARLKATDRLEAFVSGRLSEVEAGLARLRDERRRQSEQTRAVAEELDRHRRERADAERQLAEVRERSRRSELEEAEVRLRIETAVEALRRDFDCEPSVAKAAACPPLPPGTTAAARTRELERELRLMGPINPLALEEFDALQERHKFLEEQLEDVKTTRRELAKVIRAIDTEIVEVFAAAYADVSDNFTKLFGTLFPGGTGRLKLTDPDNLLETGIEVEARPSGKNVKQLSLLSGGERALTALAFLFSVFRSRPSPFYLMDEVEAALDDINLHRFLELIDEFRREAQLVIVSHQKRTMDAADCLYGVSMQPGGSSKVVSERLTARA